MYLKLATQLAVTFMMGCRNKSGMTDDVEFTDEPAGNRF